MEHSGTFPFTLFHKAKLRKNPVLTKNTPREKPPAWIKLLHWAQCTGELALSTTILCEVNIMTVWSSDSKRYKRHIVLHPRYAISLSLSVFSLARARPRSRSPLSLYVYPPVSRSLFCLSVFTLSLFVGRCWTGLKLFSLVCVLLTSSSPFTVCW